MFPLIQLIKAIDVRQRLAALFVLVALIGAFSALYFKEFSIAILIVLLVPIGVFLSYYLRQNGTFIGGDSIRGSVSDSQNVVIGEHIVQNIYQESPNQPAATLSPPQWTEQDIENYRTHVRTLHATTRILGKATPVPLDGMYTDVYLLDELTARQRFNIDELKKRFQSRFDRLTGSERREGLALVQESHNLFILGKPGAGKTTFLRYIALQMAKEKPAKLPIFITLKEWQPDHTSLMPLILKQLENSHFPDAPRFVDKTLREGQALLLFDGLDEVNQEQSQRQILTQQLKDFSDRYPHCQCLITCRIAASDYQFPRFQEVEVADFTEEQTRTYVTNWFHDNVEKGVAFFKEFDKSEHESLRELALTPLLLSLLCLVFEENMAFPLRRAELYKEALNALLVRWDSSRNIRRDDIYLGLSTELKQQLFASIAAESFEKGDYFFTADYLKQRIEKYLATLPPADRQGELEGLQILRAIEAQHSIFVQRASNTYSFSHLTFQEYFTAKYAVDHAAEGAVRRLVTPDVVTDDRWREVLLLTASLLSNADSFFDQFNTVLDGLVGDDEQLLTLLRWAEGKAASIVAPYRLSAVRAYYLDLDRALDRALDLFLTQVRIPGLILDRALDFDPDLNLDLDLDLDLDRALVLVLVLDRDLERALNRVPDLAPNLSLILGLGLDRDLARGLGLDLGLGPGLVLDLARGLGLDRYRSLALNRVRSLASMELQEALRELHEPDTNASHEDWVAFTDALRTIVITHRNIGHDWQLSEEQRKKLDAYLTANRLLLECLDVAVVSDREAIKDRLLLPPKPAGEVTDVSDAA